MADKDIKIGIKTTADTSGAKEAEAAIKKIDAAADAAGDQLGSAAGGAGLAANAEKAATQLKQTAKAADAAGTSSRAMGAKIQNLSYQAADVAVQLEMGTSAARAFTQQGSQMLAVLGPWGAIAGAALAIGGALFTASQNSREAADQVTGDAEEMSEGMKALQAFVDDAAEALEMESLGASNEAFAARIKAVEELNKRLERQLEIAKQLRDIELQKQDAESAAQIAEIEASDMPEEEKAKQVAKIRAEMDERSRQQQLNSIRLEESKAKLEVEAAKAKEAAAAVSTQTAATNLKQKEQELKVSRDAIEGNPKKIESLQQEIALLDMQVAKYKLLYGSEGGSQEAKENLRGIQKERFNRTQELEEIQAITPEKLAKQLELAARIRDAAKDELKAAEDALKDAQRNASVATEKESGVRQISTAQRDLINTQGGSAARISESQRIAEERKKKQAEDERKRREEEQRQREEERRRNAGRDLEADITGMGRDAAKATRALGGRESLAEGFEKVSRKIARKGDPQGDVSSLSSMLEKLSILVDAIPDSKSASPDAEKLRALERKMEKKIADLREQVKRDRK